ncbi:MAG: class I SAM-dependent methyltransferase [Pirellulaceae bacterium]
MDPTEFNRIAWNNIATSKSQWFAPVDRDVIDAARSGDWSIRLTGTKPIPNSWIGDVVGKDVLCLAAGGGHQGPVLAAAGARVTVLDFSEEQLSLDQRVATENGLKLQTVAGDMRDLSCFADGSFDLIINPCSTNFCPDVLPVWREAFRVLRSEGALIAGQINPVNYLFDAVAMERGEFVVRHGIPYSDWDLTAAEREQTLGPERPIDFGHTLEDLIGGQLQAGFQLTHFMEDRWGGDDPLSQKIATFFATRAVRDSSLNCLQPGVTRDA